MKTAKSSNKSKKNTQSSRIALMVVGMHRSGTSALSGVLTILGCQPPKTPIPKSGANERGYFESLTINQLHEELLHSAATCWDDWQEMPQGWFESSKADEFRTRASEALDEEFADSRLFVLKDPRICRMVPFWEDVLAEKGVEPRYVLPHRNPLEVAESLNRRSKIDTNLGLLIWLRHVLDAEAATRGRLRTFVNYAQLMDSWVQVADQIQTDLDLKLPRMSLNVANEVEDFLSSSLRHHRETDEKLLKNPFVTSWIRDTFAILEAWSHGGEQSGDYAALDKIREAFGATAPAFARLVQEGSKNAEKVLKLTEQARADKESSDKLASELSQVQSALEQQRQEAEEASKARTQDQTTHDAALSSLREELAKVSEQYRDAKSELDSRSADMAAAEERITTLSQELSQTQSALAQRRHEAEETAKALEAANQARAQDQSAHDAALSSLRAELAKVSEQYQEAVSEAQEHSTQEAQLLSQKLSKLETQTARQERELADVVGLLEERHALLEERGEKLAKSERRIAALLQEVSQSQNALKSAQERNDHLLSEHNRMIHEYTTSTSWKVTAPARAVTLFLKRILKS